MLFTETFIAGAWVIDPTPRNDERGRFMRAWCNQEFQEHGIRFVPVQANMGFSFRRGTTRGMHFQTYPVQEAKLIRCTRGSIFDVALDLRHDSRTLGKWFGTELSAENGRMLYRSRRLRARLPDARREYGNVLHDLGALYARRIAWCTL